MKQITSFMSEISDEFKTVVVEAIHSVCVKFPRKHHILMNFLSTMLREEVRGGRGGGGKKEFVLLCVCVCAGGIRVQEGNCEYDHLHH